jgi:hypothetical protein
LWLVALVAALVVAVVAVLVGIELTLLLQQALRRLKGLVVVEPLSLL